MQSAKDTTIPGEFFFKKILFIHKSYKLIYSIYELVKRAINSLRDVKLIFYEAQTRLANTHPGSHKDWVLLELMFLNAVSFNDVKCGWLHIAREICEYTLKNRG